MSYFNDRPPWIQAVIILAIFVVVMLSLHFVGMNVLRNGRRP